MQFPLRAILAGLSNKSGDDFFEAIVLNLQNSIGSDYCYIARIPPGKLLSRTLAVAYQGQLQDNFEYGLEHTPCADVADTSVCVYDRDICTHYPDDALLKTLNIEGYIGTVLLSAKGDVLGLMVAMYHQPVTNVDYVTTLFDIFSSRIAVEIERSEQEQELRRLNQQLELLIAERTEALALSDSRLQRTQQELIQRDKMSAMGRIVAGMAHEMSTPIGVALLATSLGEAPLKLLQGWLSGEPMSKTQLKEMVLQAEEILTLLDVNLRKAGELMASFKNIADTTDADAPEAMLLLSAVQSIVDSFSADLKTHQVAVKIDIPDNYSLQLPISEFVQAFAHLLNNAIEHGFPEATAQQPEAAIEIKAVELPTGVLVLSISDNGVGVPQEHREQIFEPFFTTRRNLKGSGLGLHIVYNIVVNKLHGRIQLQDSVSGANFVMTLPHLITD
jgi:two-component system NtrC family sensor kinase